MTKRTLLSAVLSAAILAAPVALAHEGEDHELPPARTSENASCVGAFSTILAQVRFRNEVNEPQQGSFIRMLAQRHGTTDAACFGP